MASWTRPDYWEKRTEKADRFRSHPDDTQHRRDVLNQVAAVRRSVRVDRSLSLAQDSRDIRMGALLKWAQKFSFNVYLDFDFGDFEIPASVGPQPMDDPTELLKWAKSVVREVRLAKGMSKIQMDVLLDQQYGVHNTWELRADGFMVTTMQRVARALGGTFQIRLEHKNNSGLSRRLTNRKR